MPGYYNRTDFLQDIGKERFDGILHSWYTIVDFLKDGKEDCEIISKSGNRIVRKNRIVFVNGTWVITYK